MSFFWAEAKHHCIFAIILRRANKNCLSKKLLLIFELADQTGKLLRNFGQIESIVVPVLRFLRSIRCSLSNTYNISYRTDNFSRICLDNLDPLANIFCSICSLLGYFSPENRSNWMLSKTALKVDFANDSMNSASRMVQSRFLI